MKWDEWKIKKFTYAAASVLVLITRGVSAAKSRPIGMAAPSRWIIFFQGETL